VSSKSVLVVAMSLAMAAVSAMAAPVTASIAACVNATGAVRIVASTSACVAGETPVSWALTGPIGPQGPAGAIGPAGPQGPQGAAGANGATGATGPIGPAGPAGVTGPAGPIGAQGTVGATGAAGPAGPQGAAGATGAKGETGPAGPQGPVGPEGPAGPNGTNGATGAQGPPGEGIGINAFRTLMSFTNPGSGSNNTTYYFDPSTSPFSNFVGQTSISGVDADFFFVAPSACTLTALNVGVNNYYSAGSDTTSITVYLNGAATAMHVSVATNGNKNSASDTSHPFAVSAGDMLTVAFSESNINPYNKISVGLVCQ